MQTRNSFFIFRKKANFGLANVKGTASTVRKFHILIAIPKQNAAFVLHDQNSCYLIEDFGAILHLFANSLQSRQLQFRVGFFASIRIGQSHRSTGLSDFQIIPLPIQTTIQGG